MSITNQPILAGMPRVSTISSVVHQQDRKTLGLQLFGKANPVVSVGRIPRSNQYREVTIPRTRCRWRKPGVQFQPVRSVQGQIFTRSEEHTSELQSRGHLVCRLLL